MVDRVHLDRQAFLEPFLKPRMIGPNLVGHDAESGPAVDRLEPVQDRPKKCLVPLGIRMSSIASTTTASTPGSPTHWGVISLGKSLWG